MKNITVFVSGEGTNLQALIDAVKTGQIRGKIGLVVSSKKDAGALKRAEKESIPNFVVSAKDFETPEKHDEYLVQLCEKHKTDLVCLAGYMLKLGHQMLKTYHNRIMNIHPALLPCFGGKGMYGIKVHETVIKSGVKLSGCTVHFVDEEYDSGPIILQHTVCVFQDDTPETLAKRISPQEHILYPRAVSLFCEDRLELTENRVKILPKKLEENKKIKRALISVSNKTGIVEFAKELVKNGVELISTSGTYKLLKESGMPVRLLEEITNFPEILSGRVKTLHPAVHAGILFKRQDAKHREEVIKFGIESIDMVVVNLYPFGETAKKSAPWSEELIENIDIGGVALLRAAAKNYEDVVVIAQPSDYGKILAEMRTNNGNLSIESRKELSIKAFEHTAGYDSAIFKTLAVGAVPAGNGGAQDTNPPFVPLLQRGKEGDFTQTLEIKLNKISDLRYGENPHQKSALYSKNDRLPFKQLQGKELSYNNILDAYGAHQAVLEFEKPACVIFKHVTPCGVGTGDDVIEAFERAWNTDPLSAFGGIIAVNRKFDFKIAEFLGKKFLEVICAPDFDEKALELLSKKQNLRALKWVSFPKDTFILKSVGDEALAVEDDKILLTDKWEIPTVKKPSGDEEDGLRFAWTAAKYVRSNAIVFADKNRTVGIGAGQMSRVDSVFMAAHKYRQFLKNNPKPQILVMASDAFFPFPDAIEEAAKAGITAVIQPGGSVNDQEAIKAADKLGLSMVLTGIRHFRH
ncbi:MAG: bifunctional phosphoribosylaminoimidazolecarboxamide formyltransferase/IMP cyclohydrolase [Elusimicrobia bacterium]|nr:bifunctional phosphoribosylaminoimidazolecarboxamide formyltransferase/IMP cyclohydrolase [Elusimicrobiota bacterium]